MSMCIELHFRPLNPPWSPSSFSLGRKSARLFTCDNSPKLNSHKSLRNSDLQHLTKQEKPMMCTGPESRCLRYDKLRPRGC